MRVIFFGVLLLFAVGFSSASLASQTQLELEPCVQVSHCVREEWDVASIVNPFHEIKSIIENSPRTKIIELNDNYIHAEVTTKWMKYVDDLELSYSPNNKNIQVRSESRVGESDLGVNRKRVGVLKDKLFKLDFNVNK